MPERSPSFFRRHVPVEQYSCMLTTAEVLAVPKNMKLLAIPLFELYDNAAR